MKPTRLRVTNFRGVKALDETIGPKGALFTGENGEGKTSAINAVRAALDARDIHPDAIRHGAKEAEILVDFEHASVRRVIREARSTVQVTVDGQEIKRPQTWLDEVFGGIDALAFYGAKETERRAMLLAALPVTVTIDLLRQWAPDLPSGFDVSGHGIDALKRVRDWYYDRRHAANAEAKAKRAESVRLSGLAPAAVPDAPSIGEADAALDVARRNLATVEARDAEARRNAARVADARRRIAEVRAKADAQRVDEAAGKAAADASTAADARLTELRAQLAAAEREATMAREKLTALRAQFAEVRALDREAEQLDAVLADTGGTQVDPAAVEAARSALAAAESALSASQAATLGRAAIDRATEARGEADAADAEAARLDRIVVALTDDAPRALPGIDAIPGLALDGEAITLDGVVLDKLSGKEQLVLAVKIAKRANAGKACKLLIVDELEKLDSKQLKTFVSEATFDGWTLLGTRVADGALEVQAIGAQS